MDTTERWGVWRSDGVWMLQQGTREPWVAQSKDDAEREAREMNSFATATQYDETYEARVLPPVTDNVDAMGAIFGLR